MHQTGARQQRLAETFPAEPVRQIAPRTGIGSGSSFRYHARFLIRAYTKG